MKWKDYEKKVFAHFSRAYPGATITHDVKTIGRYSKTTRHIDILIEDEVADYPIRIAVDAKYFSKRIDVKCVESFISMMDDIDAHQGVLITCKGFSKAAIDRAYYGPSQLELDIFNFDDLLKNQGLEAVPYSGSKGLVVSAPFGWVIDNSRVQHTLTCLYQRGIGLQEAQKNVEWMYLNFWHKTDEIQNIDDLISYQNESLSRRYTNLQIEITKAPKRHDDLETRVRLAVADDLPCIELTGFIDCGEFIAFFVMFSIEQLKVKNHRKLLHVLKYSQPVHMTFDNNPVIEQLKNECEQLNDPEDKSAALNQIACWYLEMGDKANALAYHRQSYTEFTNNYDNLKRLISLELSCGEPERTTEYSLALFRMEPKNPTVMQDILRLYRLNEHAGYLAQIVESLVSEHSGNQEALGNIKVHYGEYLAERNDKDSAMGYLESAKEHFEVAFDGKHHVIKQIVDYIDDLASEDHLSN